MPKTHLIILQILGILALICGYLISDQPDCESVMHFNVTAPHTISAEKNYNLPGEATSVTASDDHAPHKFRNVKYFSFEVVLPQPQTVDRLNYFADRQYAGPFPENYLYLFLREINPPPPKVC